MNLVEIRDLDGPNLFLLQPAIKVEIAIDETEPNPAPDLARRLEFNGVDADGPDATVGDVVRAAILRLHELSGTLAPESTIQRLETPGHLAVAYGWDHRRFAVALADTIALAVGGETVDLAAAAEKLRSLRASSNDDDRPLMVRDDERRVRSIAITGTNGKTTTTRLIAHILRGTGKKVGWCSSSGVYIDGEEVIAGDYSGPSGARRVLAEPGLDAGILETARGGILLRGTAYESNDVSVFTNISADHLDLQGVRTVEGLARVKSVVTRVTKADGVAVLNADDPLVMGATTELRAAKWLTSQRPDNPALVAHLAQGGTAIVAKDGAMVVCHGAEEHRLIPLAEVPITFDGKARHMVENALSAAAASLAFGLSEDQVRQGLSSFENSPEHNQGRLNVIPVDDFTVIVDYAHNESGLQHLLDFARLHVKEGGRLITVIGTAGDRTDESLRAIGRVAAEGSDLVIIKGTERYLRGRPLDDLIARYHEGIELGGKTAFAIEDLELPAMERAMDEAKPGDVVSIMAQEQIPEMLEFLRGRAR